MITSEELRSAPPEAQTFVTSTQWLRAIVTRRLRTWLVLGSFVFCVALLIGLYLYPQSYATSVSIALQQDQMSSPLSALSGLTGGGPKKYLGVLKSRSFAEQVENMAHLQQIYHLHSKLEAVEKIRKNTRFDDNMADGLIYIDVTLDAPALKAPDSSQEREKARLATSVIANGYSKALLNYMITQDTDKELTQLRTAAEEVKLARRYYDSTVADLAAFIRSSHIKPQLMTGGYVPSGSGAGSNSGGMGSIGSGSNVPGVGGGAGSGSSGDNSITGGSATPSAAVATGASQYSNLYLRRANLEVEMKSQDAMHERLQKILEGPLEAITAIPGEDPLLYNARLKYNSALQNERNLENMYGPDNPRLVLARDTLRLTENTLREQTKAILEGNTTDQAKRKALQAEYDEVNRQIKEAEKNFQISRELSTELSKREYELGFSSRAYGTALERSEELKLTLVSAKNRMTIVDEARSPLSSKPMSGMIAAASAVCALFSIAFWLLLEFTLRMVRASQAARSADLLS